MSRGVQIRRVFEKIILGTLFYFASTLANLPNWVDIRDPCFCVETDPEQILEYLDDLWSKNRFETGNRRARSRGVQIRRAFEKIFSGTLFFFASTCAYF